MPLNSPALSGRVYRFGIFELDLCKKELLRRGMPVRVQDQPFRVLCMLVERQGTVVTRDELRRALWPSDTYVEFACGLNATLKRLRFARAIRPAIPPSSRPFPGPVTGSLHPFRWKMPRSLSPPGRLRQMANSAPRTTGR